MSRLHTTGKFRGPDFEPIEFRLPVIRTTALTDTKGRLMPTVMAEVLTEAAVADDEERTWLQNSKLLRAIANRPDGSIAEWAEDCVWFHTADRDEPPKPYKSLVVRVLKRLTMESSSRRRAAPTPSRRPARRPSKPPPKRRPRREIRTRPKPPDQPYRVQNGRYDGLRKTGFQALIVPPVRNAGTICEKHLSRRAFLIVPPVRHRPKEGLSKSPLWGAYRTGRSLRGQYAVRNEQFEGTRSQPTMGRGNDPHTPTAVSQPSRQTAYSPPFRLAPRLGHPAKDGHRHRQNPYASKGGYMRPTCRSPSHGCV
jgi:hypothetical protein